MRVDIQPLFLPSASVLRGEARKFSQPVALLNQCFFKSRQHIPYHLVTFIRRVRLRSGRLLQSRRAQTKIGRLQNVVDIGIERLSLRIEACQLDELLKRMSKEQATVFIQGVRRRVQESLPGSTAATSLHHKHFPKSPGGLPCFPFMGTQPGNGTRDR